MGGKERLRSQLLFVGHIFQHRAGNAHTVKRGGSASDLIQNQKTILCGAADDLRHLAHLHHERRLSRSQIVRRADAGENAVRDADIGGSCRDKAANLRH